MTDRKIIIKKFIVDNYLFGDAQGFEDKTSFLEEGIIDSTGMLELVDFLEERFSIEIDDEEMIPENLDSIDNLLIYVNSKLS